MKNLFLALFLVLDLLYVRADNAEQYNFTYYQMREGLCDEYVLSTYQDSSGYMWFCTSNGLDRFDGNVFVHYSSSSTDKNHRINSNFVRRAVEDDHHHLWVISDVGLIKINLLTGMVEACSYKKIPHDELLSQPLQALFKDRAGNLWLGAAKCVIHVCLDNQGNIGRMNVLSSNNNTIVSFTQQDNVVWAGGHSGICRYSMSLNNESVSMGMGELPELKKILGVQAILAYGSYLWVGTRNGLYYYDTGTLQLKNYLHVENLTNSISSNNITSLTINRSGDIIIGTRSGINIFNRNNIFEHIEQEPENKSINTNLVNDVYIDRNSLLWVGTSIGGVNLISPKDIITRQILKGEPNSENIVSRVFEDKEGNLFAGIINKGLAIRRAGEKEFHLYNFSKVPQSLVGFDIRSIKQDYNNDYWIATSDGLNMLRHEDLKSPKFTRFTTENSSISLNIVYDMVVDNLRKGLWICHESCIDFMDLNTHKFTRIKCALQPDAVMRNLLVLCLDRKDNLWIGGNGLYRINLSGSKRLAGNYSCKYYEYKLDNPSSRISEKISSIVETQKGELYIGSQSNGLYKVRKQVGRDYVFQNLPINYLVSNIKISSIQENKWGNLWISTVDGVYYFDTKTQSARKYDYANGLPISQFYIKSGCMLHDGSVCFGTVNGFLNLSLPFRLPDVDRKVFITNIQCDGKLFTGNTITRYDVFPEDQSFEIFFSALEYNGQNKITYAYKIDELDEKWNICSRQNGVRYTNLPPGSYTLRVKCTNPNNSWSSKETLLQIKVHPSFYQTTWFFLLLLFIVLTIAAMVAFWYVHHQKKIQKYLKEEVNKRTHTLAEQKTKLEQKTGELNNTMKDLVVSRNAIAEQNILLQNQNQEINKQKDKIEEFSRQMEKADKEKLMLFTNLTHEFKTPLTLILGPTHKLGEINKNPKLVELIQIIERNAQYLLFLLNQIIDLRRVDARQLKINNSDFNIEQLFKQDISDFANLFDERRINLELRNRMHYDSIISDKQFVHTILFNLVSNAVKYTPNGGTITIRFCQLTTLNPKVINQYISVSNTGSYIEEGEREKIFDCFYKIENQATFTSYGQSSTGIGLFLVKQIVNTLKGRIFIKSLRTRGTTFRVYFPVQWIENEKDERTTDSQVQFIPSVGPEDIPFSIKDENKPILLVVEDNKDMREYIKGFLERSYNVAEAINGERGFEMAKQIIPDFIISDMMMPKCDGLAFCRMIREEETLSHIPFLMLTALSDDNARFDSYNQGVDAFLTKPFDPQTLLARINNIIKNNKIRQNELSYDLSQAHASVLIKDADKQFLEKITEIMEKNYSDSQFNVAELLECMGMSSTSFYKKTMALTGLSASNFIRLYRLQTAKKMIDNMDYGQNMNISEIAYMVGFNDPKYFTRCFVKQYKVTPSSLLNK